MLLEGSAGETSLLISDFVSSVCPACPVRLIGYGVSRWFRFKGITGIINNRSTARNTRPSAALLLQYLPGWSIDENSASGRARLGQPCHCRTGEGEGAVRDSAGGGVGQEEETRLNIEVRCAGLLIHLVSIQLAGSVIAGDGGAVRILRNSGVFVDSWTHQSIGANGMKSSVDTNESTASRE